MEVIKQWSCHWVKHRLQLRKFRFPFKTHPIEQLLRWFKIICKEYRKVIWISRGSFRFYVSHEKFLGLESDSVKFNVINMSCAPRRRKGITTPIPPLFRLKIMRTSLVSWWFYLRTTGGKGHQELPPGGQGPVKRWLDCRLPTQLP